MVLLIIFFVVKPFHFFYFRCMILVTGATGLVGSHLLYALAKRGEKIRATKRPTSHVNVVALAFSFYGKHETKWLENIEWVDADLLNPADVEDLFEDVTHVFNCAALVSFNPKDKYKLIHENPAITSILVNEALQRNVVHFAHVSSVAAIGRTKDFNQIITEETEWKNGPDNSNYAVSKHLAELEVWRGIEEGLCAAMINPTVVLGAGNWNNSSNTLFKKFSKPYAFYTNGCNGFVDVRDVVDLLLKISDQKINNQRFIAVGENISYKALTSQIATAFNQKPPHIAAKKWMLNLLWRAEKLRTTLTNTSPLITKETTHSAMSSWQYANNKATEVLQHTFRPIHQSIAEFVAFYKSQN